MNDNNVATYIRVIQNDQACEGTLQSQHEAVKKYNDIFNLELLEPIEKSYDLSSCK